MYAERLMIETDSLGNQRRITSNLPDYDTP